MYIFLQAYLLKVSWARRTICVLEVHRHVVFHSLTTTFAFGLAAARCQFPQTVVEAHRKCSLVDISTPGLEDSSAVRFVDISRDLTIEGVEESGAELGNKQLCKTHIG